MASMALVTVPFLVQVHAAHSGGVSVQRVHALARLGVPHFQCAVGRATDDGAVLLPVHTHISNSYFHRGVCEMYMA